MTTEALCLERALGCGPCQLVAGHPGRRHLCGHYAKGGVEMHDANDLYCGCPDCTRKKLVEDVDRATVDLHKAMERHREATVALREHDRFAMADHRGK